MSLNPATAATAALILTLLTLLYTCYTITRLRNRLARARHAAAHDPLTGLPNRRRAQHLLDNRIADQLPTVVALLDLDGFKHVNDTHGHLAGDLLLATVADRLHTIATGHGGHAARLAGDEFLLLLPTAPGDAVEPVAGALTALAAPIHLGTTTTLTPAATAGVAVFDGIDGTWTSLLHRADLACYHAKTRGHRLHVHHHGMSMPTPPGPHRRGPRPRDHRRPA